ncbi:hypothetical protein Apa02nite_026850 [Actinoplanes palleronii]|uniref:Uncharacterized protein n=1 Tax=Actinoplanes palleronii TaxID=113570 RepID=A0ABQ4B7A8_9ACTN|nr:hypothetical protein Apa02nite_026850 [Actinoplanes palleronii]
MNWIDVDNVGTFKADSGSQCRNRSFQTSEQAAAGNAAQSARSWHGLRESFPDSPAAPPRTVGVKE